MKPENFNAEDFYVGQDIWVVNRDDVIPSKRVEKVIDGVTWHRWTDPVKKNSVRKGKIACIETQKVVGISRYTHDSVAAEIEYPDQSYNEFVYLWENTPEGAKDIVNLFLTEEEALEEAKIRDES